MEVWRTAASEFRLHFGLRPCASNRHIVAVDADRRPSNDWPGRLGGIEDVRCLSMFGAVSLVEESMFEYE